MVRRTGIVRRRGSFPRAGTIINLRPADPIGHTGECMENAKIVRASLYSCNRPVVKVLLQGDIRTFEKIGIGQCRDRLVVDVFAYKGKKYMSITRHVDNEVYRSIERYEYQKLYALLKGMDNYDLLSYKGDSLRCWFDSSTTYDSKNELHKVFDSLLYAFGAE